MTIKVTLLNALFTVEMARSEAENGDPESSHNKSLTEQKRFTWTVPDALTHDLKNSIVIHMDSAAPAN